MPLVFRIFIPSKKYSAVEYNEQKVERGEAERIYVENFLVQNLPAYGAKELEEELKWQASRHQRIKEPQFHAMISCKEKTYTYEELKECALKVMDKLGYRENPLLIYKHKDTDHRHIHIVTSRVGNDNQKIRHHMEGYHGKGVVNGYSEKMDLKHAQEVKHTLKQKR